MSEILKKPATTKGPGEWFTGDVWFDVIAPVEGPQQGRVNSVRFSPGARTAWHRHVNGQLLHVIEGAGLTQVRGGEIVPIHPGDTVWCPAGGLALARGHS
jgi:quercetin dioxygenase-like cupin family protein